MSDKFDEILSENKRFLDELQRFRSENSVLKDKVKTLEQRVSVLETEETTSAIEICGGYRLMIWQIQNM